MQIDIQALNIPLSDELREYVKRRLYFAIGGKDETIQRVNVRLSDINGPRGGKDMCCHIQVSIAKSPDIVIKDVAEDLHTAVDRAAGRAGRTLARQLQRKADKHRVQFPMKKDAADTLDQSQEEFSA